MQLDKNELNDRLIREWFKKYTSIAPNQFEIFIELKNIIQSDLSMFYQMNKIIVEGQG